MAIELYNLHRPYMSLVLFYLQGSDVLAINDNHDNVLSQ